MAQLPARATPKPVDMTGSATPPNSSSSAAPPAGLGGCNVLLMGPTGTGKTYAIGSLVELGYEVFYLALENGLETLIKYFVKRGQPIPANLHWARAMSNSAGFGEQLENAKRANSMSLESLSKINDPNKSKYDQFRKLLGITANFVDERTGKTYGAVDSWGTDRVFVIDGLTGISTAAMQNYIGGKAVRNQSDWGIAQGFIMNYLRDLCDGCRCHFVLLAHIEREQDLVLGGIKLMPSTLGKAIAGLIPPMFSDAILTERTGDKWLWNTAAANADVKTRNLPVAAALPPSFAPIMAEWEANKAAMELAMTPPAAEAEKGDLTVLGDLAL